MSKEPLGPSGYVVLSKVKPGVLSKPWANTHRGSFAEDARQHKDKTNKPWNRRRRYTVQLFGVCVCVNPLCLCESSVFWPYLGSFTVNRWVRNSVYLVSGGWRECWIRGKDGEKRQSSSLHTMIYLSIPHPVSLLSTHSLLSSSYFSSSLDWPTCLSSSEHFKFNLTTLFFGCRIASLLFLPFI